MRLVSANIIAEFSTPRSETGKRHGHGAERLKVGAPMLGFRGSRSR